MSSPDPLFTSFSTSTWMTVACVILGACAFTGCVPPEDNNEAVVILPVDSEDMSNMMQPEQDMQEDIKDDKDMGGEEIKADMPVVPAGPAFACDGEQVSGVVYMDNNLSSGSRFVQRIDDEDELLVGEDLVLIGTESMLMGQTCEDGTFGIDGLEDGLYILGAQPKEGRISASSSQGLQFIKAVQEGELEVLVFGDSIPAFGPTPWYPTILEGTLDQFADTNVINIASPGARSVDWLPGVGGFYEDRLAPRVESADVIVFSLGGNDLYEFANNNMDLASPEKVGEALEEFDVVVEEIIVNLKLLITEIRKANPDADIVWMLYPNYATSDEWAVLAPDFIDLIANLLRSKLNGIRKDLAHHEGLLIWDMLKSSEDLDLDDYLSDPLHLNVAGHVWWERELFMMLGGVIIEDGVRADSDIERDIGFGLPQAE